MKTRGGRTLRRLAFIPFAFAASFAFLIPPAAGAFDIGEAVAGGKTALGFRYRLETVSQDGIDEDALASTARARLTWNSAESEALTFGVETDYSLILGIEDFNSTTNGKTAYPVVADPDGFDLNQAFLKYKQDSVTLTVGRQRINHGTQRFMGGVAYRNNEQTYDGVRIQTSAGALNLDYAYVHNINRIFGPDDGAQPGDWYGNSHALRATVEAAPGHTVAGYAYLWDLENDNGPANANATYGIEYVGAFNPVTITAAVSNQSDYGDNPVSYDAMHYLIQGDIKLEAVSITAAYEVVGSDDGAAQFRFPAATLHKFQGWTDKFLIAPATGVRNTWVSVSGNVAGATVTGVFHDFRADSGGADYGQELGLSITYPVRDNLSLLFKVANYSADEFATDTTKAWLMFDWRW
ncbi:MAG: alginate export family protein [Gammaproteobacteria bacterium]|nr:alginate export family protein [Gammaproteobacteria bacterium]